MFGYVRPNRDELKVRELRDYEALYCGLCHALGRRHGFFARFFLNYDFTFLAMLLDGSKPTAERKHCPARLWCRKKGCICAGSVDAAADAGTILSYWKLRDTVADGSFWKGTAARVLSFLLRPGYRRAAQARPEFDRAVRSCLEELQALEQEGSPSLDRTADTFARILQGAAPAAGPPGGRGPGPVRRPVRHRRGGGAVPVAVYAGPPGPLCRAGPDRGGGGVHQRGD